MAVGYGGAVSCGKHTDLLLAAVSFILSGQTTDWSSMLPLFLFQSCLLCLADGIVPMAVARSIAVSGSHPEVVAFIGDRALADTMASVAVQMLIFNLIFPLR